ncbi:hypothetical protein PR202_gb06302 [Eleusine coracana subsp. coracana]|uniref:Uncharacterized protein n=1 Tax=Eleusine coracana subsp. coracana TaxID=191504 RepID=A0AAV5EA43_ELECO|nr:hypothetical protein QOZ80_2BG0155950 [Eleusine coracana subsp. coracana]GJN19066.1 hypothetical protein PR202_gb06302 [Eleusine coracana subsp. coracana]
MASAVASSMPAAGPAGAMPFGWLGPPRLSFGAPAVVEVEDDESSKQAEPAAISKEFIDFEFRLGGSATMLPADELFADGKLLPLRPQPAAATTTAPPELVRRDTSLVEMPPTPERVKALHPAALDPYVFSPKAPTCSSRWRELLRLRKVQTPPPPTPHKPSPSPAAATPSRASTSSAARSLKLLLQRNTGRASTSSDLSAAPLLRDSSDSETSLSLASSRFSLSSSSSSSAHSLDSVDPTPRHSLDSVDPTPRPRIRLVRSAHPHQAPPTPYPPVSSSAPARAALSPARARTGSSPARRRPTTPTPPPPSVASVDSPRMNASGKIVFQGLERSSSSPAGSVHHTMRTRSRVMDRSYSAGVRATPVVLNVPVCSRPVFGFFKDKKDTAGGKDSSSSSSSSRPRSALGRRTPVTPGAGVSCRDLVNAGGN